MIVNMAIKQTLVRSANRVLRPFGAELVRTGFVPYGDYRGFIPFEKTIEDARAAGLSVGDYLDSHHNVPGATQASIDEMARLGALHAGVKRVCEIGPGSGRYLEKVIVACKPTTYEIYETAPEWRDYLVKTYDVIAHQADGVSLHQSASSSFDLVHAHKVFPGVPFVTAARYFKEMARLAVPGGYVVFDFVTEACMDPSTLDNWLGARADYQVYPNLLPKQYVCDLMRRLGLRTVGSFRVENKPGATECFVFQRT